MALKEIDYDLDLVGFTPDDLARLFNGNSGGGCATPTRCPIRRTRQSPNRAS